MSYGSSLQSMQAPVPRKSGFLVIAAFLSSALVMGAVILSLEMDSISQLPNDDKSSTTLRLLEQQVSLHLSDDPKRNINVIISFNHNPVTPGQFIPMNEAQEPPIVTVKDSSGNSIERYTYVLIDIDAPDPEAPTHAPFLHYILADLSANNLRSPKSVIVPYYPVSPPVGEHRYVSLLFREDGDKPVASDVETIKRTNFDVDGYAVKHNLVLVATSSFHSHPAAQEY